MNNVYTIQEIMTLKFCELSNVVYEAILAELTRQYEDMIDRLLPVIGRVLSSLAPVGFTTANKKRSAINAPINEGITTSLINFCFILPALFIMISS